MQKKNASCTHIYNQHYLYFFIIPFPFSLHSSVSQGIQVFFPVVQTPLSSSHSSYWRVFFITRLEHTHIHARGEEGTVTNYVFVKKQVHCGLCVRYPGYHQYQPAYKNAYHFFFFTLVVMYTGDGVLLLVPSRNPYGPLPRPPLPTFLLFAYSVIYCSFLTPTRRAEQRGGREGRSRTGGEREIR